MSFFMCSPSTLQFSKFSLRTNPFQGFFASCVPIINKCSSRNLTVLRTVDEVRSVINSSRKLGSIGLVPTMGALHAGHLELVKHSKQNNAITIASIFVNPTQFLPGEDFTKYPRTFDSDCEKLKSEGVDYVFSPENSEIMYSKTHQTYVDIEGINSVPEGSIRPGHFRGVATIVTKLFNVIQPNQAYFGQKDGIQCLVIKRIVRELNMAVNINIVPTVRESDGLAMSSRNIYLSKSDRAAAPILYKSLTNALNAYKNDNVTSTEKLKQIVESTLLTQKQYLTVQYISIANINTGEENKVGTVQSEGALLSIACKFGSTRLIDNIILQK